MSNNNYSKKKQKKYPIIFEFLPLILFFILNKFFGIFFATGALIFTSIINFIGSYIYTRTLHPIAIITLILALIFGSLTLLFHEDSFIKIKITLMNLIFAGGLLSGYIFKRNFLRFIFRDQLSLTKVGWNVLNVIWIIFFIFLAVLNEIIWRNVSTNAWVNFKVFGILGLSMLFIIVQMPLLHKYSIKKLDKASKDSSEESHKED